MYLSESFTGVASYNNQYSIEDADCALDALGREDLILDLLGIVFQHGMESFFGVRLLHKHNDISDDDVMLEEEELDSDGVNCLVTYAKSSKSMNGICFPNSWKLEARRFQPSEFSLDPLVQVKQDQTSLDKFLNEFADVLRTRNACNILGLCVVPRSYYNKYSHSDMILVESTNEKRRANIVRFDYARKYGSDKLVDTSWIARRIVDSDTGMVTLGKCVKENCVTHKACVKDGKGGHTEKSSHSNQHVFHPK